jgi:hypothetical protein
VVELTVIKLRRGQMRILEAIIACIMILTTYFFIQRSNYSVTVQSKTELKKTADNLLNTLENQDLLVGVIDGDSNWEVQLNEIIRASIPSNVYYNVTFTSLLSGNSLGVPITNISNATLVSQYNTVSTNGVYSLSYPVLKQKPISVDVMLVIDKSGSMNDRLPGDTHTKLYYAKLAAQNFLTKLKTSDRVGLSSFESVSILNKGLTSDFTAVSLAINSLNYGGSTNLMGGINKATTEIVSHGNVTHTYVMIVLTDGVANYWDNYHGSQNERLGCQYAEGKAQEAKEQNIKIFSIGLGSHTSLNETLLQHIQTNGYYYAPSAQDLDNIYQSIADQILSSVSYDVVLVQVTLKEPLGV